MTILNWACLIIKQTLKSIYVKKDNVWFDLEDNKLTVTNDGFDRSNRHTIITYKDKGKKTEVYKNRKMRKWWILVQK